MREIRFRAWNYEENKMVHVDSYHWEENGTYGLDLNESRGDHLSPLMQFTGLKDKNGKEIYEGDIVEDSKGRRYQIFWDGEGKYYLPGFAKRSDRGDEISMDAFIEVIGNIYENPELLKV